MPPDALGERRERFLGPGRVEQHGRPVAVRDRTPVQPRNRRVDEPREVGLARLDVEPAGLDPCSGSEQVEGSAICSDAAPIMST